MSRCPLSQLELKKNEPSDTTRYLDNGFKKAEAYLSIEVLRHFPMAFYWMDKDGYLLGANEVELQFLGLKSLSQFIGKHVCDFGTIDLWENCQRVMNEKATEILEEKWMDHTGEKRTFLVIKSPLQGNREEVVGLVGVSIDITPNRKVEEVVMHVKDHNLQTVGQHIPINSYWIDKEGYVLSADDVELKNFGYTSIDNFIGKHAVEEAFKKTKEETKASHTRIKSIASCIAHELRTPISAIGMHLGCAENLFSKLPNDDRDLAAECFQAIRKEIESTNIHINMLLMNILEQLNWQMEICSINYCVEEALRRYPFVEDQRSKVFWKRIEDFSFKGDTILMQHVIFNLLKNALLQINKTGKGEITIWTKKESSGFSLHFKDTASGVPKDILAHLFERFYSRTKNGIGLGLAFCKMVIESFGGTICCNSEEAQYMEFVIKFKL